jgi:hypothetical protein
LVCEQTPTDNANDNYGILALPNLETKFVAANTLIGLKKDFSDKLDLQNDELKVLKNQLLDIRHKHFSAPNVNEKHKLRKQDAELRKDIKAYLIESSTKPNAYKIELLKNQLLELKSQKKQYEDEKWEDTTLKPKQQVALDFGFDTLPETQPTIFLIDVNKQKRDEIDALIKQTENEIIREESKTHIDGFEDEAEKLAHWNPYDQNTSSPFFDPEWMFGIKEGFDVVIGNPPYHQLSKDASATDDYKLYLKNRFNTSGGRLNTFIFFTHLGVQILKQNGVISYIIPNTILSQDYYKETRKYLLDETIIKKIVSYDHLPFENAVVENITFVCVKNKIENNLIYHYVDNFRTIISDFVKQKADFYKTDTYTFNFKSNELTDKIAENSINLGSICLINQAIALKGDKSLSLRSENSDFKYYRLLDGRNINRYSINWSGVYLDYDVNRIHSCKNKLIFLTDEKLLFRRVSAKLVFAYDNEQYFALNTIVVVNLIDKDTFNLKYLLSILNSKLIDYYYFNKHKSTKTVFSEIQARSVSELPIKYSNKQALFITLVDQILSFKKENPQSDTTILEQQIDNLVYKLYDLTYEEVKVVDPAFALTEEEYYSIEIA